MIKPPNHSLSRRTHLNHLNLSFLTNPSHPLPEALREISCTRFTSFDDWFQWLGSSPTYCNTDPRLLMPAQTNYGSLGAWAMYHTGANQCSHRQPWLVGNDLTCGGGSFLLHQRSGGDTKTPPDMMTPRGDFSLQQFCFQSQSWPLLLVQTTRFR